MPDLTTSETLNLAADLIEERGWTQGAESMRCDSPSGICLEGAISAVFDDIVDMGRHLEYQYPSLGFARGFAAYKAVETYLNLRGWGYNDTPGRTAEEVIAVLRATAVIESARENSTTLAGLPGSEVPA